jgi:hypothetical protein
MVEMDLRVHFNLFHSKTLGELDFPLSVWHTIARDHYITKIEEGGLGCKSPHTSFDYKDIPERASDAGLCCKGGR